MKIINHLPDLNYYTEMGNFCLSLLLALNIYNLLFKKYFCYFEMLVTSLPLAILGSAIFKNDFSLAYVAAHSHSHLAWGYQLGALWAGHEGSWLLWLFILGLWKFFFNRGLGEKGRNTQFTISMNRLLSLVIIVFALLSKYLSNPFALQNNWIPQEGMDLNPVLQDPALIIHPPFLFLGYAGLILPWAWSVVVLIRGRFSVVWLKLIYPWILCTFSCLSIGIALGSWWAYYELGWGGFWFWDPVENASLMPWLISLSLIHAIKYALKNPSFINHQAVLFLSYSGFCLSLMGTFLVRSGLITSVHAFAQNRAQAKWFLSAVLFFSSLNLILHVFRWSHFKVKLSKTMPAKTNVELKFNFKIFSLCLQSLIFSLFALIVFLGTILPFFSEIWNISLFGIEPAYFNQSALWILGPVLLFLPWILNTNLLQQLFYLFLSTAWSVILVIYFEWPKKIVSMILLILSLWLILSQIITCVQTKKLSPMRLAHIGFSILIFGVLTQAHFGLEKNIVLEQNKELFIPELKSKVKLSTVFLKRAENFGAQTANLDWHYLHQSYLLESEKRLYWVRDLPTTEVGISPGFSFDLYWALGENLGNGKWSSYLQIKPFIRSVWLGSFLVALAGMYGAYRKFKIKK